MNVFRGTVIAGCAVLLIMSVPNPTCAQLVAELNISQADREVCEHFRKKAGEDRISEGNAVDAIFVQRYTDGRTTGVQWLKKPIIKLRPTREQLLELLGKPTHESRDRLHYDLGGTMHTYGGVHGSAWVTLKSGRLIDFNTLVEQLGPITNDGSGQKTAK